MINNYQKMKQMNKENNQDNMKMKSNNIKFNNNN